MESTAKAFKQKINCKCKKILWTTSHLTMAQPEWVFQQCDKGHVCGKWKIPKERWWDLWDSSIRAICGRADLNIIDIVGS